MILRRSTTAIPARCRGRRWDLARAHRVGPYQGTTRPQTSGQSTQHSRQATSYYIPAHSLGKTEALRFLQNRGRSARETAQKRRPHTLLKMKYDRYHSYLSIVTIIERNHLVSWILSPFFRKLLTTKHEQSDKFSQVTATTRTCPLLM